jgi:hypothetical protein
MEKFNEKLNEHINENVSSIRTTRRQFYPRNFELSQEFLDSFKLEYKRLIESGQKPKALLEKINKALRFHV